MPGFASPNTDERLLGKSQSALQRSLPSQEVIHQFGFAQHPLKLIFSNLAKLLAVFSHSFLLKRIDNCNLPFHPFG
jgi:hypothetical protein